MDKLTEWNELAKEYARENIYNDDSIKINIGIIKLDKSTNSGNLKFPEACTRLAMIYLNCGQKDEAISLYEKIIEMNQDPNGMKVAKRFLNKEKNYIENTKILDSIKNFNEAYSVAMSIRRSKAKSLDFLEQVLNKAYSLASTVGEELKIAIEYRKIKRLHKARKIIDNIKATTSFPNSALNISDAATLRREKNLEEAEVLYNKILENQPGNKFACVGLTAVLKDLKEHDKAYDLCETLLEKYPRDPYVLKVAMSVSLKIKDWQKSEKIYNILKKYYKFFNPLKYLNILIKTYECINYVDGLSRMKYVRETLENEMNCIRK